jgi:hypothetical protein
MAEETKAGGNWVAGALPKFLVIVAVLLIVSVFVFGVKLTIEDLFWATARIVVAVVILFFVAKGIQSLIAKPDFSPTARWKDKLIRVAEQSKPFNVKKLFIRGEDMRVYSYWGKITGLAFVPYLSAGLKKDEKGNYKYVQKKDRGGNPVFDKKNKPVMEYEHEILTEKEGEWVFIVQRGLIPLFATKEIIRSHINFVSDIGENVWIKTPNLLNIGDYFYPCQQWQRDIVRIHQQHQTEALVETYQEFLDLVALVTTMSMKADPIFRKAKEQNVETIQSTPMQQG